MTPTSRVADEDAATIRWLGLALLGILIAAAISIAASRLASQQIGLASQPISAGDSLGLLPRHDHIAIRSIGNASPTGATGPSSPGRRIPPASAPTPAVEPAPQVGAGQSEEEGDHGAEGGGSADD